MQGSQKWQEYRYCNWRDFSKSLWKGRRTLRHRKHYAIVLYSTRKTFCLKFGYLIFLIIGHQNILDTVCPRSSYWQLSEVCCWVRGLSG